MDHTPSLSQPTIDPDHINSSPWYPRVLVIGPGGLKGLKALGFLSPIEDSGVLEFVDSYCGVSVGSLICLLIICGYPIREIVGEAVKMDIFKEVGSFDFRSVMENKGFISSEPVRKRLTQLVINKFGNIPTLYGLYMMTGKAFISVTLNATDETCVMLNPFDNQNMSCVDATMFSMNVPFVFYQLVHNGKTYVDGALANPYPVDYFDDGETNILGIYMKTTQPKNNPTPHSSGIILQRVEESAKIPIGSYYSRMIHSLFDHRYYNIVNHASDKCKHVCLNVAPDDMFGFNVSMENKASMLIEGFNEGKTFLTQIRNNSYSHPKIPSQLRYTYPPYFMMGDDEPIDILAEMSTTSS
ncbi:MAG: patatin-like phospholipase family protein [Gemmatimonadales bacterium]